MMIFFFLIFNFILLIYSEQTIIKFEKKNIINNYNNESKTIKDFFSIYKFEINIFAIIFIYYFLNKIILKNVISNIDIDLYRSIDSFSINDFEDILKNNKEDIFLFLFKKEYSFLEMNMKLKLILNKIKNLKNKNLFYLFYLKYFSFNFDIYNIIEFIDELENKVLLLLNNLKCKK